MLKCVLFILSLIGCIIYSQQCATCLVHGVKLFGCLHLYFICQNDIGGINLAWLLWLLSPKINLFSFLFHLLIKIVVSKTVPFFVLPYTFLSAVDCTWLLFPMLLLHSWQWRRSGWYGGCCSSSRWVGNERPRTAWEEPVNWPTGEWLNNL